MKLPKNINWRWVEVGFCLYVVFHLLPSFLLASSLSASQSNAFSLAQWAFVGIAPIGFFIGYRSTGVTILEPGLSALLYMIVLALGMQRMEAQPITFSAIAQSLSWMGGSFVVAVVSAWAGEKIQTRRTRKTA